MTEFGRKKTAAFQLTMDADSIALEPIKTDRYAEFANQISREALVEVILGECEAFRQQKLNDVSRASWCQKLLDVSGASWRRLC